MRVRFLPLLAASVVALSMTGAYASPQITGNFAESGTEEVCGIPIDFDFTQTVRHFDREVPGSDGQAYRGHFVVNFSNVLTNPANGEWLIVRGHEVDNELSARHVDGNIWEFTAQSAGQPFMIENSDGKVVLRDRGRTTSRFLFDTLGDGQPGGELLEVETTGVFGPHPSLGTDAFCAVLTELIG